MKAGSNGERQRPAVAGAIAAAMADFFVFMMLIAAAVLVSYQAPARNVDSRRFSRAADDGHHDGQDLGRTGAALRSAVEARRNSGREAATTTGRSDEREKPAVAAGLIAAVMGGFFVFVALVTVGLFFFYQALAPYATFARPNIFPAPRLQTRSDGLRDPEIARQQADLERFRWIDKTRGEFQIPIEQAMKMVAARGARAYDPVPSPPISKAASQ
jgi:hypothetical protein